MIPTNDRRFPPCLPQSSPPAEFSSSDASASGNSPSGTSAALNDALNDAESYRTSAFPLTRAQRATVTLANAFNKQKDDFGVDRLLAVIDATADQAAHTERLQTLVDLLMAEWHASNSYLRGEFPRTGGPAWQARADASAAVALGLATYRAEVQA